MAVRRLGIVMHGVTGRMGSNQHLARSIAAIRAEGGVLLANGDRVMPDPILVGRNEDKLAALAKAHGISRVTTNLDGLPRRPERHRLLRCGHHADAARAARQGDRRRQARLLREAGRHQSGGGHGIVRKAKAAGIKHGVVQDKLFLPGLRKLKMMIDSGFFGRILVGARRVRLLGVRGRPAAGAAPLLELPRRGRRRHHPRHALPLALRARQHLRQRQVGLLPRRHPHPRAHRRGRQALQGHRR